MKRQFWMSVIAILATWSATLHAVQLTVVDAYGHSVAGARILVGQKEGIPFAGNLVTTNDMGFALLPDAWTTPLPVTVDKPGYLRVTYNNVVPNLPILTIQQEDRDDRLEFKGSLTNYGTIRTDGKVDFGLVIPAIRRDQLLNLDVSVMVSPESDMISVVGKDVEIPSNLTLPEQRESYIFPITLNKPNYRMFARTAGMHRFAALHGQFPLKRVVDDVRAKEPIYDVINHLNLIQTGIVDLDLKNDVTGRDIAVNQIQFSNSLTVKAPVLAANQVMLTLAMTSRDGYLIPSDIKRLQSNETLPMKVAADGDKIAVSVILREMDNQVFGMLSELLPSAFYDTFNTQLQKKSVNMSQVSLALHPANLSAPQFLNWVAPPVLKSTTDLSFTQPASVTGIEEMATYVVYSKITTVGSGKATVQMRTRLWEMWTPGWVNGIQVPELPSATANGDKFRWEVMFLGSQGVSQNKPLPERVTHVSRNALDI